MINASLYAQEVWTHFARYGLREIRTVLIVLPARLLGCILLVQYILSDGASLSTRPVFVLWLNLSFLCLIYRISSYFISVLTGNDRQWQRENFPPISKESTDE